jgi:hypothetical protein
VETVNYSEQIAEKLAEEDASTKEDAIIRARELALERNATINVVYQRLVGMDELLQLQNLYH